MIPPSPTLVWLNSVNNLNIKVYNLSIYYFPLFDPTSKSVGINAARGVSLFDNKRFICSNCAALYALNAAVSSGSTANTRASLVYKFPAPSSVRPRLILGILSLAPTTPRLSSPATNGASSRVYY